MEVYPAPSHHPTTPKRKITSGVMRFRKHCGISVPATNKLMHRIGHLEEQLADDSRNMRALPKSVEEKSNRKYIKIHKALVLALLTR